MSDMIDGDKVPEVTFQYTSDGIELTPEAAKNFVYKRSQLTLEALIKEYIVSYSCATIKRTAPYGGSAPIGITKMLQAVALTCNKNNNQDYIECGNIYGVLSKDYKISQGTHQNLCRLSAQPFPLIQTGKQLDKNSPELDYIPLYDESTGTFATEKYSNVMLSSLGEIAFKDSSDISVRQIVSHKGIVPIALLRKGLSWALGHHSTMYSLNPSEIFKLQERMLELNTPYLPNEVILDIFRGPDLGKHYIIYMTNDSLSSLYSSGTGSMMVVPEITIDRYNRKIIFKRPPLDRVGTDFKMYLNKRLAGGRFKENGKLSKEYFNFDTISADPAGEGAFVSGNSIVMDVIFNTGNDAEIIDELHSDPRIYQNVPLQNILLKIDEGAHIQTDEVDLDTRADFNIDVVPIYEILWEHIEQEVDIIRTKYTVQLNKRIERLKWDLFLEKVTRPEVSEAIMKIWSETNMESNSREKRKIRLEDLFKEEETRDKTLLKEGFDSEEIREICRHSVSGSNTGLNIINIMSERDKYKDLWESSLKRIEELKAIVNDENSIYIKEEIRKSLATYSRMEAFKRKSEIYYIEPIDYVEDINTFMLPQDDVWKNSNLPCSIFYSKYAIVKSYGRNINIIPNSDEDTADTFSNSINCMMSDQLLIFGDFPGQVAYYNVRDFTTEAVNLGFPINAVIPMPKPGEKILLNIRENLILENSLVQKLYNTYILDGDNLVLPELKNYEYIMGYAYLDKKYVKMVVIDKNNPEIYRPVSYLTEDIISNHAINQKEERSNRYFAVDTMASDTSPIIYNLLQNEQSDSVVVEDSLKEWRDTIPGYINPNRTIISAPIFLKHIEYYSDNVYIPWLSESHIITVQTHEYIKHGVLAEPHFCHPKDLTSRTFKNRITTELRDRSRSWRLVSTKSTKSYNDFQISDLEDWSLIDPRYRLPMQRPTEIKRIDAFNNFFSKLADCRISERDYMKLEKEIVEYRTVSDKESDNKKVETGQQLKQISSTIITPDIDITEDDDMVGLDE